MSSNMEEDEPSFTAADVQQGSISHLPGFEDSPFKKSPVIRRRQYKKQRRVVYSLKKPLSVNRRNIMYNRTKGQLLQRLKRETEELREEGYTDEQIRTLLNGDAEGWSDNDNEGDETENDRNATSRLVQSASQPLTRATINGENILESRLRPRTGRPSYKVKLPTSRPREPAKRGRPPKRRTSEHREGKRPPGRPPKAASRPDASSVGFKHAPGRPPKAAPRPVGRPPKNASFSVEIKRAPGRPRKEGVTAAEPKRPRGRPPTKVSISAPAVPRRGRGRPPKVATPVHAKPTQSLSGLFLSAGVATRRLSKAERIAALTRPLTPVLSASTPGVQMQTNSTRGFSCKVSAADADLAQPSIEIPLPRKRGRPPKNPVTVEQKVQSSVDKREKRRGRPRNDNPLVNLPTSSSTGTSKRGPGRPRKNSTSTAKPRRIPVVIDEGNYASRSDEPSRTTDAAAQKSLHETPKRGRGRPPKRTFHVSSAVTNADEPPVKRPRGRPPKNSKK